MGTVGKAERQDTSGTAELERRGPGRPRIADLDRRILRATVDELCANGAGALTLEAIAIAAGVAKTTIYRRWPNKTELMVDAIDLLRSSAPVYDSGDARADLTASLQHLVTGFSSPDGAAVAAVFSECRHNPRLAHAWQEKIAGPHRAAIATIFERGVASGQLRRTLSTEEAISLVDGVAFMVLFHALPPRPGLADDVIRTVLDGMGTRHLGAEDQ